MTNFVLCIHVQIRFASTEKNYSHRLACILLFFPSKIYSALYVHPDFRTNFNMSTCTCTCTCT